MSRGIAFYVLLIPAKIWEAIVRVCLYPMRWVPEEHRPRIRFLRSEVERIGHIAIEPDTFVKQLKLGLHPDMKYLWVVRRKRVGNLALMHYWRQHLRIIDNHFLVFWLWPISRIRALNVDLNRAIIAEGTTAAYVETQQAWVNKPPLLKLSAEDKSRGAAALQQMGLKADDWYVCIHCRESGYLREKNLDSTFRNADILSYREAIEEITARGGWVIRMGDETMTPLPPMERVVDYAVSADKSEWLDVFLSANCRFFLGCTSGLALVASVFGRPVAQVNAVPLSTILFYNREDLGIAKHYVSVEDGRALTFAEIMQSSLAVIRRDEEFAAAGVRLVDNSPAEIRDLVLDMFDQESADAQDDPAVLELERQFLSLMQPTHYAYGCPARVGRRFLKQHADLLECP